MEEKILNFIIGLGITILTMLFILFFLVLFNLVETEIFKYILLTTSAFTIIAAVGFIIIVINDIKNNNI